MSFVRSLFVTLAGLTVACSAQVEPTNTGEPLAVLHGNVTGASTHAVNAEAALLWGGVASGPSAFVGGFSVPVATTGTFPTTFDLKIFEPPPREVLGMFPPQAVGGPDFPISSNVGVAQIVAIRAGSVGRVTPADVVGTDPNHGVLYLGVDGAPGSAEEYWAKAFHVPSTRGYHVYTVSLPDDARVAYDQCRYANICEEFHRTPSTDATTESWMSDYEAWDTTNCKSALPAAEVCVHDAADTTAACVSRLKELRSQAHCTSPRTYVDTAGDGGALAIVLGASIWTQRVE